MIFEPLFVISLWSIYLLFGPSALPHYFVAKLVQQVAREVDSWCYFVAPYAICLYAIVALLFLFVAEKEKVLTTNKDK